MSEYKKKSRWEKPSVTPLGELARAKGDVGNSNIANCSNGNMPQRKLAATANDNQLACNPSCNSGSGISG